MLSLSDYRLVTKVSKKPNENVNKKCISSFHQQVNNIFYNFLFLIPCFCLKCNFKSYRQEQLNEQLVQLNWLGFFFGWFGIVIRRFEELEEGVEGWEVEVVVVFVMTVAAGGGC